MESVFFDIVQEILGNGVGEIIAILFLIIITISRIRKIRKRGYILSGNSLYHHPLINYIEYINKYRIKNVYHNDKGKEAIMRTLLKCFIDALDKNVKTFLEEANNKDFNKKSPGEITKIVNYYTDNFLNEYKMLFREKAEVYLSKDDVDNIIQEFKNQNSTHIASMGKIIFDLSNSITIYENRDIIISVLDLALSAIIQISLDIECVFENINGSLIGKEFRGIKIQE